MNDIQNMLNGRNITKKLVLKDVSRLKPCHNWAMPKVWEVEHAGNGQGRGAHQYNLYICC